MDILNQQAQLGKNKSKSEPTPISQKGYHWNLIGLLLLLLYVVPIILIFIFLDISHGMTIATENYLTLTHR